MTKRKEPIEEFVISKDLLLAIHEREILQKKIFKAYPIGSEVSYMGIKMKVIEHNNTLTFEGITFHYINNRGELMKTELSLNAIDSWEKDDG